MVEVLCPFLGFSWQKRPGHTGKNPGKDTEMVEGLELLTCGEQLRELGLLIPKGRLREGTINICKHLKGE